MASEGSMHLDETMGAAYIGVLSAAILYGVSFAQTWYYFLKYWQDAWYIKALVASVWLFETTHQILVSHSVYHYVIRHYGHPSALVDMVWSILLEVLFNAFIALLVQGFLIWRVWKLSKNIPLVTVIGSLILAGFGCSIAFTTQSMKLLTWADLRKLKWLSVAVNVIGAVIDVSIAAALSYFLHSSRTGFKKSDTMISKLISFVVKTGFLTSVCALASLISILAFEHTLIYVAFYFCLGRLYSNSMLATLNARQMIRATSENSDELSFSVSKSRQGHTVPKRAMNISINIDELPNFYDEQLQRNTFEVASNLSVCSGDPQ